MQLKTKVIFLSFPKGFRAHICDARKLKIRRNWFHHPRRYYTLIHYYLYEQLLFEYCLLHQLNFPLKFVNQFYTILQLYWAKLFILFKSHFKNVLRGWFWFFYLCSALFTMQLYTGSRIILEKEVSVAYTCQITWGGLLFKQSHCKSQSSKSSAIVLEIIC